MSAREQKNPSSYQAHISETIWYLQWSSHFKVQTTIENRHVDRAEYLSLATTFVKQKYLSMELAI